MDIEPIELKANLNSVTRAQIETFYAENLLTNQAREFALNLLYPQRNWIEWISRFLLMIGASLILSGIIYFFAFNWTQLTTWMKFSAIEAGIIICLVATYFFTLQQLLGKILLTSAAVLIGVFLAVFGQIYQSGADVYQLFMMWAILISIWVIISNFAALWIIWAVIIQIAVGFYWTQVVYPTHEWEMLIFPILGIINLAFLIAREYGYLQGLIWLQANWTRTLLILAVVFFLIIAPIDLMGHFSSTQATLIGSLLCCIIYLAFFYYYRYQQPDLQALSAVIIAICVLLEFLAFRLSIKIMNGSLMFFGMSAFSLILFTLAVTTLRKIAQLVENNHV